MADPNSVSYENRSYILIAIQAVTLTVAFTLLGSRLYVRFKITKSPGWDDLFIVIATVKMIDVAIQTVVWKLIKNTR